MTKQTPSRREATGGLFLTEATRGGGPRHFLMFNMAQRFDGIYALPRKRPFRISERQRRELPVLRGPPKRRQPLALLQIICLNRKSHPVSKVGKG